MQKLTLAAIGAACLLATPVLAQTTTGTNNGSDSSSSAPMSQADLNRAQQKITHDLTSDGFTNVKVIPNSFLVHATNKRNEPVVMIINPDSVFAVTQLPNKQASAENPNGASGNHGRLGNSPSSSNSTPTTHQ